MAGFASDDHITRVLDTEHYSLFLAACVVLVMVPGPDMAYILARCLAQGRKAGVLAAVGINTGAYVHLAGAVLGLSAVLVSSTVAFTVIKWVGAIYLLWLGIRAIFSAPATLETPRGKMHRQSAWRIFWQGFLVDVLNPKVAIFFLAFLPQFVDVEGGNRIGQLFALGITVNVLAVAFNLST